MVGKLSKAEACFRKALDLQPNSAIAYNGLGLANLYKGRLEEAEASFRKALAINPGYAKANTNILLCLNYNPDIDEKNLFEEHKAWDVQHGQSQRKHVKPFKNNLFPEKVLNIGYVSGDFGRHPVGYFMGPVLPAHDRNSFKIFCYSGRKEEDDLSLRLHANSDVWCVTNELNDDKLVEKIRADGIDILVDLSGHTANNRLTMFARKPSPIQITWAGYVGTTGLSAIDYLISDNIVSPQGAEKFSTEKILRLPDCYICYEPPEYAPSVRALPAVQNGFVTFGCFNNFAKVTPQVMALWAQLLKELPGSRLLLKNHSFNDTEVRERCLKFITEEGIEESRIDILGSSPHSEYLECYNQIDIALDPFPFSGGLTTLETLWMGVPVVTLDGERFCSRHSLSFIKTVGLSELIASDPGAYIEIACELAKDLERISSLRSGLRERMAKSPLCDGVRFTRNLEAAYRKAWQSWCSGKD